MKKPLKIYNIEKINYSLRIREVIVNLLVENVKYHVQEVPVKKTKRVSCNFTKIK